MVVDRVHEGWFSMYDDLVQRQNSKLFEKRCSVV
jgi:hypothetical protein